MVIQLDERCVYACTGIYGIYIHVPHVKAFKSAFVRFRSRKRALPVV